MTSSYVMWPLTKNIYIHIYFDKKYVCSDISHILRWDRNDQSEARTSLFGQSEICQMSCGHSSYWISISCHIFYRGSPFVRTRVHKLLPTFNIPTIEAEGFYLFVEWAHLAKCLKNMLWLALVSSSKNVNMKMYCIYGFSFCFVFISLGLK